MVFSMSVAASLIEATRPWSFTMTIISVCLGSLLALQAGFFAWHLFVLLLLGMVLTHGATNVINDYFDHRHGVDRPDSATALYRRHPILEGVFRPVQVLAFALALYGVSLSIGVYLTVRSGWPVLLFIVGGGLASFFYTGGPIKYKHRGMGELSVFLMWGPLMVTASYFVLSRGWSGAGRVVLASLPQGLWVALVLFANNLKDIGYDRETGVVTLANLMGRKCAEAAYMAALGAAYAVVAAEVLAGALSPWTLLVFASIPLSLRLAFSLKKAAEVPPDADPRTAKVGMIFGILYLAGFLLEHLTEAA
jgi:1,4-dihydroxy-2-naphthoate octaprenyltransferase